MPIPIHGKNYVTVAERVQEFHAKYPNGAIATQMEYAGDLVRCRATVTPDVVTPARFFTGHAEENRKDGQINATSSTENVETSAVGRAIAFLGIASVEGIASADEMVSALSKTRNDLEKVGLVKPRPTEPATPTETPVCQLCNKPMVQRKGPKGTFWGCSQYPKCSGKAAKPAPLEVAPPPSDEPPPTDMSNIPF